VLALRAPRSAVAVHRLVEHVRQEGGGGAHRAGEAGAGALKRRLPVVTGKRDCACAVRDIRYERDRDRPWADVKWQDTVLTVCCGSKRSVPQLRSRHAVQNETKRR
jgi:hypothetical protein